MKRPLARILVCGLAFVTAFVLCAPPAAANDTPSPPGSPLTTLSSASLQLLRTPSAPERARNAAQDASDDGGFLRSKKGALALALVGAGIGIAWWAHKDSREEVRSPAR